MRLHVPPHKIYGFLADFLYAKCFKYKGLRDLRVFCQLISLQKMKVFVDFRQKLRYYRTVLLATT